MARSSTVGVLHPPRGEAIELCSAVLAHLQDGSHERIPALIDRALAVSGGMNEPALAQLLHAANRIATAWSTLAKEVSCAQRALADTHDRVQKTLAPLRVALDQMLATEKLACAGATASIEREPALNRGLAGPRVSFATHASACSTPPQSATRDVPTLSVHLLRPFQVTIDARPIAVWPGCKAKSLFKFLLLNRSIPVTRELLMERFWPDADPASARNRLNVTLYNLRSTMRRLAPKLSIVVHDGGRYTLDRDVRIWTDADAYSAHLARAHVLERADKIDEAMRECEACIDLYRHELLAEDPYEPWIHPLRVQLRDSFAGVLERLSAYYLARGRVADCVTLSRRLLEIDSCNEQAHRRLIGCYARLGQLQLARAQYRICVQALAKELNVTPSEATTEAYRSIGHPSAG